MSNKKALIVDDESSLRDLYSKTLKELDIEIYTVSSGNEALKLFAEVSPDIIISDIKMPEMDGLTLLKKIKSLHPDIPFLLITAFPSVRDAVLSLKTGAVDYLEKPVDLDELKAVVRDILALEFSNEDIDIPKEATENIVAQSSIMKNLLADSYRFAKSDVTVLITGESGTGKEVIASFIYKNSERNNRPFVTLNCASLPANILNSELFGHKKGAFTGAVSERAGKFKEADKGTLFLDEIGDMPLELQSSLLRAIENKTISPLGSDKEIKVDVRLVAATNKNLEEEISAGRFRGDLFYRLNVIALEIPPLRERRDDIIPLARFFLKTLDGQQKKLSASAIRILSAYQWPGNVRELSNAMKRAKVLSRTELIMPEHLPPNIRNAEIKFNEESYPAAVLTIEETELTAIKNALKTTKGNQTKAAELLGISRRTLLNKLKKINRSDIYKNEQKKKSAHPNSKVVIPKTLLKSISGLLPVYILAVSKTLFILY